MHAYFFDSNSHMPLNSEENKNRKIKKKSLFCFVFKSKYFVVMFFTYFFIIIHNLTKLKKKLKSLELNDFVLSRFQLKD